MKQSSRRSIKEWSGVILHFFSGQLLIQLANFATALILLRLLALEEYALYTITNTLLVFASTGADLNLSTALTTFGARQVGKRSKLGELFASVKLMRLKLFIFVAALTVCGAPILLGPQIKGESYILVLLTLLALTMTGTWANISLTLYVAIFNIHHDSRSVVMAGLSGAMARLALTSILCFAWNSAMAAIAAATISILLSTAVARHRVKQYLDANIPASPEESRRAFEFVKPLVPATLYAAIQGQISLLLVTLAGQTTSIAEVGALSRFGQLIGFLGIANGFLFQPMFARIDKRAEFVRIIRRSYGGLVSFFLLLLSSAYFYPHLWILILGQRYSNLEADVLLAILGASIAYFVNFTFTILASRAFTRWQYIYIVATILSQFLFLATFGVVTTRQALELNFVTGAASLTVQLTLLALLLQRWK